VWTEHGARAKRPITKIKPAEPLLASNSFHRWEQDLLLPWYAVILSWLRELPNLCSKHTCWLIPEDDPLFSQRGKGTALSDEYLHQMCWEPFTPLNIAQAQLLPEGEGKACWTYCWQIPPTEAPLKTYFMEYYLKILVYTSCGHAAYVLSNGGSLCLHRGVKKWGLTPKVDISGLFSTHKGKKRLRWHFSMGSFSSMFFLILLFLQQVHLIEFSIRCAMI
jgi:hypothetical protein